MNLQDGVIVTDAEGTQLYAMYNHIRGLEFGAAPLGMVGGIFMGCGFGNYSSSGQVWFLVMALVGVLLFLAIWVVLAKSWRLRKEMKALMTAIESDQARRLKALRREKQDARS